ncbi:transposon Ty3-I Gag-Pol polyprotein [Trichonephila clavipes]|nr:transposon Ty3-I Gag-Pol polyprotein [Trichonephila clavipes]
MLQEGIIRPIQSPYAPPVVLTRKNNGLLPDSPDAYRFAIDYRKLNAITKYPRYPLPVIDDLITNIPHTGIMSTLDLKSGYFQLVISPKDIEKTAFITRNGTFCIPQNAIWPFRAAPNFQKAVDNIETDYWAFCDRIYGRFHCRSTHPIDTRQSKPSTEGSRQGASVQYDRAWETRTTPSGGNSAVERRPVQSRQATAVRPCPYYLRSRVKQPEGIPEEQRSNGIDGIPQNNLRRSLSMEALDGDPVDRSE